jgi:hypothetical protein
VECNLPFIQYVPDFSKRMKINHSLVTCINEENGCTVTDQLDHISFHEATCTYKNVKCTKCNKVCCEKNLTYHNTQECEYRLQECDKCGQSIPLLSFESHKQIDCVVLDVSCDYCSWTGTQHEKKIHVETCKYVSIPCRYHIFGCTSKVTRNEMSHHENEIDHFPLICTRIEEIETEWNVKWLQLHQDGPYHIRTHHHTVTLCSDEKEDSCSECKKPLRQNNKNYIGYYCAQGCMYVVCTECFNNVRLYKSKVTKWYKK